MAVSVNRAWHPASPAGRQIDSLQMAHQCARVRVYVCACVRACVCVLFHVQLVRR